MSQFTYTEVTLQMIFCNCKNSGTLCSCKKKQVACYPHLLMGIVTNLSTNFSDIVDDTVSKLDNLSAEDTQKFEKNKSELNIRGYL